MFLYIFFNNQKLLILFNEIDVIGGKSLVKPWLNMILGKLLIIVFIDNSFEERRKILRGEQLEKSIINIKLI